MWWCKGISFPYFTKENRVPPGGYFTFLLSYNADRLAPTLTESFVYRTAITGVTVGEFLHTDDRSFQVGGLTCERRWLLKLLINISLM